MDAGTASLARLSMVGVLLAGTLGRTKTEHPI